MGPPPIWDDLLPGLLALADQPRDGDRVRTTIRLLSAVTLAAIVAIAGVGLVAMMLIRRHRRKLANQEAARRSKRRPAPDPWFEAARRVPDPPGGPKSRVIPLPQPDDEPRPPRRDRLTPNNADDDTVDLDPDELDEHDVEGDETDPDDSGHPPSPGTGPRKPKPTDPDVPPGSRGG